MLRSFSLLTNKTRTMEDPTLSQMGFRWKTLVNHHPRKQMKLQETLINEALCNLEIGGLSSSVETHVELRIGPSTCL